MHVPLPLNPPSCSQITIAITDVNDNSPMFDEALYNISLLETTALGTIIERVIATDLDSGSNAELVFDFLNGNIDGNLTINDSSSRETHLLTSSSSSSSSSSPSPLDTFAINPEDGTITLAKRLDHDSGQVNYSLIIIARNIERNETAMMFVEVIDVNDHAPEFKNPSQSSYPLTIYEVYYCHAVSIDQHACTVALEVVMHRMFYPEPRTFYFEHINIIPTKMFGCIATSRVTVYMLL